VEPCPFCAIAAGVQPANVVHESAQFVCFEPLQSEAPGHLVIATRAHYASLLDAPPQIGSELIEVCQHLAKHSTTGCEAFNLLSANGADSQQSVMHLHLHFVPRRSGDGIDAWPELARGMHRGG
jgi:histidine triad (HIT) family protein